MESMFKVGDKVEFGRAYGEKTLGEVKSIGRTGKLKIAQLEERGTHRTRPAGTIWTVPPQFARKVEGTTSAVAPPPSVRRPEGDIMDDFLAAYAALSPENLSADGERTRAQVAARYSALKLKLRTLAAEYGRMVSEDEAYKWFDASRRTA